MKLKVSKDLRITVEKHLPTEEVVVLHELQQSYNFAVKKYNGWSIELPSGIFILFIKSMVIYIAQDIKENLCALEIKDYPSFIKKITICHEEYKEEITSIINKNKETESLLV